MCIHMDTDTCVCAPVCVCTRVCAGTPTASLPWTFSRQSLTIRIVTKVLSSKACALGIGIRTDTLEGRAPGARGSKVAGSRAVDRQAARTFLQEGLGASSRARLQQTRGHRVMLFYGTKADTVHCLRSTLIILSSWRVCHQGSDMPLGFYLCCPRRGNGERGSAFH